MPKAKGLVVGHRTAVGQRKSPTLNTPPVAEALAQAPPPEGLPADVHDVWRACVTEMTANRHLREPDLVLLKAYCEAAHLHLQASADIHANGLAVATPYGPATNPLIRVQKDAATTIRQLSDMLGLNPLARIRAGLMQVAGASMVFAIRDRLDEQLRAEAAAKRLRRRKVATT